MAVERDQFIVELVLDSKGAIKGFQAADGVLSDLDESLRKTTKSTKGYSKSLDDNEEQTKKNAAETKELTGIVAAARRSFLAVKGSVQSLALTATALNQSLELVGKGFRAVKGVVDLTAGSFGAYETALVGVQKTTDISGDELQQFGRQLQNIALTEIPVATNELLRLAEVSGQLGVRGTENLSKFAVTIAKLGRTTDVQGEAAALALTRILNITGDSVGNVDRLASVLVELGNNFAALESEILTVGNEVARSSSQFGLTSAQSLAFGAALKSLGQQAQLAGSVVGKAFRTIQKAVQFGGQELRELEKITGIAGDELRKRFAEDSVGTFQLFLKGLNRVKEETNTFLPSLEALGLVGDEVNKVIPVLASNFETLEKTLASAGREFEANQALNKEAERAFGTFNAQVTFTTNALKALGIEVGKALVPILIGLFDVVKDVSNSLTGLVKIFNDSEITVKDLGAVITAAAAGFVTYKIAVSGAILANIKFAASLINIQTASKIIAALPVILTGKIIPALVAARKAVVAFSVVALKFTLIAGLIASVAAAVELVVLNFDKLGKLGEAVVLGLSFAWQRLKLFILESVQGMLDSFEPLESAIGKIAKFAAAPLLRINPALQKTLNQDFKFNLGDDIEAATNEASRFKNELKDLAKASQLEFGVTGKILGSIFADAEKVKDTVKETTAEQKKQNKVVEDLVKVSAEIQKLREQILAQILLENEALKSQVALVGSDQQTALRGALDLSLLQLQTRRDQLAAEDKLNAAIGNQLDLQGILLTQLANAKIDDQLIQQLERITEETNNIVVSIVQANMSATEVIVMQNDLRKQGIALIITENQMIAENVLLQIEGLQAAGVLNSIQQERLQGLENELKLRREIGKSLESQATAGEAQAVQDVVATGLNINIPPELAEFIGAEIGANATQGIIAGFQLGMEIIKSGFEVISGLLVGTFDIVAGLLDPRNIESASRSFSLFENLPDRLITAFENFDRILISFIDKFPAAISRLADKLPELIQKIIDKLPAVIQSILDAIPQIIQSIFDALPGIIDLLFDALISIVDQLPAIFSQIVEQLPGIINKIFDRLPDLIGSILEAIPQLIASLIAAIPDIFEGILDRLPEIIETFISGVIAAFVDVAIAFVDTLIVKGGILRIAVALVKGIVRGIGAIVKGILSGLSRGLKSIFSGIKIPIAVPKAIQDLPEKLGTALTKIGENATKVGKQLFGLVDVDTENARAKAAAEGEKIISQIQAAGTEAFKKVRGLFQSLGIFVRKAWQWVVDNILKPLGAIVEKAWQWVVDNVLQPIGRIIQDAWQWVNDNVIMPLLDGITAVFTWVKENVLDPFFDGVQRVFKWVADNVVSPIVNVVRVAWQWVIDNILSPLGNFVSDAWQGVLGFFQGLAQIVQNAWRGIIGFFQNLGQLVDQAFSGIKNFFAGLGQIVQNAWQFLVDLFESLPNLVKAAFSAIVSVFQNLGDFVMAAFQPIIDFFSNTFPEIVSEAFAPVSGFFQKLGEFVMAAFRPVFEFFSNLANQIGNAFSGVFGFFNNLGNQIAGAFSSVTDFFKGLKLPNIEIPFLDDLRKIVEKLTNIKIDIPGVGGGGGGTLGEIGRRLPKFQTGGFVGPEGGTVEEGEFVLNPGATASIGPEVAAMINRTGQLPQGGQKTFIVKIEPGAINITEASQKSATEIAEETIELIKRRTADGEPIVFTEGLTGI